MCSAYAVAAAISLVFFPAETDDAAPTPVTVTKTVTVDREGAVLRLGRHRHATGLRKRRVRVH